MSRGKGRKKRRGGGTKEVARREGQNQARSKRRTSYKRNDEAWQARARAAHAEIESVRISASLDGIRVDVSVVQSGRTTFEHWRFVFDGRDILHYWPASEKYWIPGKERGKIGDPHAALWLTRQQIE